MMKYRFIIPERNTYNTKDENNIMNDIVSFDLFINEKSKKIEDIVIGKMISSSKNYISSNNRVINSTVAIEDYHQSTNQFDYIYTSTINSTINQVKYSINDLKDPDSHSIIKEEVLNYLLNLIKNDDNFDFTIELSGITFDLSDINIEYFILDKEEFNKYFNINNDITNYNINELEVLFKNEVTTVMNTYRNLLIQLKDNAKNYNTISNQENKSKFAKSLVDIFNFWKSKMELLVDYNVRDIYLSDNIDKVAFYSIDNELNKLISLSKKYSIISNYLKYDFGKNFTKKVLDSAMYFYFKNKTNIRVYNIRRTLNSYIVFMENKINPMISIYIELKNVLDPNFKIMDGFIFDDFDEYMAKVFLSNSPISNNSYILNNNNIPYNNIFNSDYSLSLNFIPSVILKEKLLTKDSTIRNSNFGNSTSDNSYNTNMFNRSSTLNYRDINIYKKTKVKIEYFDIKTIMNSENFDQKYKSLCKNIISNLIKSTKDYLDNMETFEDLELTRIFRLSIDYKRILNKLYLNKHFNHNGNTNIYINNANKMNIIKFDRVSKLEKLGYYNLVEMNTKVYRDYFLDFIHNYLKKHKKTHITSNILNRLDDMFKLIDNIFEYKSYSNAENEDNHFIESFINLVNIFSIFKKKMLDNPDANVYNKKKKFPKNFDFKDKSLYNNILLHKILNSINPSKFKSKLEDLNKSLGMTPLDEKYKYIKDEVENYRLGFYNKSLFRISNLINLSIFPILSSNFPLTYNLTNKKDMYFSNSNKEVVDEKLLDLHLLRYIKSSKVKSWTNNETRILENVPEEFFIGNGKSSEGDPDGNYTNVSYFNVQSEHPINGSEIVGDLFY